MPPDLDVHQLLLEHDALGSFDGADYVRLDAVWRVPHDGSAPRLLGPWRAWATSTPARVIAAERQLLEQAQMISDRDALIVRLQQQLADATRGPPAVAARVAEPVAPFDLAVAMHASPDDKRRRAHQGPAAPPLELPPGTAHEDEYEPARWRCPKCGRDAFTQHPSRDWCLDCAAKLPRAA